MTHKEGDFCSKWIPLIRKDDLKEVLNEAKKVQIESKTALECIVALNEKANDHVKKIAMWNCSPSDLVALVDLFSSAVSLVEPQATVRYLTSLYHILNFLLEKDCLQELSTLFKIVTKFRQNNSQSFKENALFLRDPYIFILKQAIVKGVKVSPVNQSLTSSFLKLLLEMVMDNSTLENGKVFLQVIFLACQTMEKGDKKMAVRLVTKGLSLFERVSKVEDADSCLPVLFNVYLWVLGCQVEVSGVRLALRTVESHLNQVKWKFSDNARHGQCFMLLCTTVKLFICDPTEDTLMKKISDNNDILTKFLNISGDKVVLSACNFMLRIVSQSLKPSQTFVRLPSPCLDSFLRMIFNMCSLTNKHEDIRSDNVFYLSLIFLIITEANPEFEVETLKKSADIVFKAINFTIELLQDTKPSSPLEVHPYLKTALVRCANVIRTYTAAKLSEDTFRFSKPVCKFICSLPSDVIEKHAQQATDLAFSCLVDGLGPSRLDEALDSIVVWITHCPQSCSKAFLIWSDIKHNTICLGPHDHTEYTFWTGLTNRRSRIEAEWAPIQVTNADAGKYLLEELNIYFITKSLREKPVIAAGDALLSLSDVGTLVKVKGLVIAMDVASATNSFPDKCKEYYNKSKAFVARLKREKKNIDPVEFNCCMGDLLYSQLRCKMRFLRSDAECEMVRLSKMRSGPRPGEELPENQPDPNDVCDEGTVCRYLCLERQRKLLDSMDSALRHWSFANSLLQECSSEKLDMKVTLVCIRDAGLLLKLYCDQTKQRKMFQLLYNMATRVNNSKLVVFAVGELLNINEKVDDEWVENAKNLSSKLGEADKARLSFELNTALHYLNAKEIPEGLEALGCLETKVKKSALHLIKFYGVLGEYQKLRDWHKHNFMSSIPSYHLSFHKALKHLLYYIDQPKWGSFGELCEIQLELLQVSHRLGEINWIMEQPREARCYLKTAFPVAQKLALPLRTMQILLLLAWVDYNTGLISDCAVKLEELEDLLELCGTPLTYDAGSLDTSTLSKRAMLDTPDYLSHLPACPCLPCTTMEYRRLVLETFTLRAAFCATYGNPTHALHCFKVAIKIAENLMHVDNAEVLQSCARTWLRYAYAKMAAHEYREAKTANTTALQLLSSVRDKDIGCLHIAIEQKFLILRCISQCSELPMGIKVNIEAYQKKTTPEKPHTPVQLFKAPGNFFAPGKEKSPLTAVNENISVTPYHPPVIPFKLSSSGSGEENTPSCNSKTKRKTKLPKFVTDPPQTFKKTSAKSARKPFVILDDDGNAVAVSGAKPKSIVKKKITKAADKSKETEASVVHKKLFTADLFEKKPDLASPIVDSENFVLRKSKIKTYGRCKLPTKKELGGSSSTTTKQNEVEDRGDDDVFSFDQMKNAIAKVEDKDEKCNEKMPFKKTLCEPLAKQVSKSFSGRQRLESSKTMDDSVKGTADVDCDFIEGTPPPEPKPKKTSKTLIPKRPTRSNKI